MTDADREDREPGRRRGGRQGLRRGRSLDTTLAAPRPEPIADELANQPAILTGNRAGVVESANEAWTRITGFPLRETLGKPISHFLDAAGIEVTLVDFVGQHFLEGRSCTVEFPFRTFDEREIQVHLEVEPIRDPRGELIEFRAVAHDISDRRIRDLARLEDPAASPAEARRAAPFRSEARPASRRRRDYAPLALTQPEMRSDVSISDRLHDVCDFRPRPTEARTHIDLDLAPDLPLVATDARLFEALVEDLLDLARRRVEGSWGWVSVLSGQATSERSHLSRVHPVVARFPRPLVGEHLYVEIHDSSPTPDPGDADATRDRLVEIADALAATLLFDDTAGCGHQSLILIPVTPPGRS